MKYLLAAAMLAALVSSAGAAQRYDHKLEAQVKQIIAAKIGDIRGTLPYDKIVVFPAADQLAESPSIRALPSMPVDSTPHFQVFD